MNEPRMVPTFSPFRSASDATVRPRVITTLRVGKVSAVKAICFRRASVAVKPPAMTSPRSLASAGMSSSQPSTATSSSATLCSFAKPSSISQSKPPRGASATKNVSSADVTASTRRVPRAWISGRSWAEAGAATSATVNGRRRDLGLMRSFWRGTAGRRTLTRVPSCNELPFPITEGQAMKKATRTLLVWSALALSGVHAAAATAAARAGREEADRYGRVVRGADGVRVTYPDRPPVPPARPVSPRKSLAGPLAPNALAVTEEWRFQVWGDGMGASGLHAVDLDADGDREIVAAAASGYYELRYWYVASRRPDGSYEQDWSSDEYPYAITSLAVAQVDGDPALEVVLGTGGQILVYDGATRQLQFSWASPAVDVTALAIADADGDGALEAVFCDDTFYTDTLYVYTLATGAQELAARGYGCRDLAVGNVDADPSPEIVIAQDWDAGFVIDGATHALQWSNAFGFGDQVALGDVDGDGRVEIVAGPVGRGLGIFDAQLQSLERTLPISLYVAALEVLDVEGDGPLEIVYGDDQWGMVHVHNGQTLALKWEVDNPEHGVTGIAFGNLDTDPVQELVWGSGYTSSGPDFLYVADTATRLIEWTSLDLDGPFRALSFGDVDADGRSEILYGNLELATWGSGPWFVRDALTKALEYQSAVPDDFFYDSSGLWRIANADVDADPQQEIVTTRIDDITGERELACYDGLTHAVQWHVPVPLDADLVGLRAANVDADPAVELVLTTVDPLRVFVLSASSGAVEWESPSFQSWEPALLRIGNVDADPNPEIVFASVGSFVFVIDGVTHAFNNLGDFDATSLDLADRNHDGVQEILVGTDDGRVLVVSPGGAVLATLLDEAESIDALRVVDLTGDGALEAVIVTEDTISVRDGVGGAELWNSGRLRYGFGQTEAGRYDSLIVDDVDADGKMEIFVNLGALGIRIYEVPQAADLTLSVADAPDPALVGANVTYTWTVTNPSAVAATNVGLAVTLPVGASFVSSTPGAPTCVVSAGILTCALGGLASTTSATVTVVVTPTAPGTLASSAVASADQADPDATNNTASATTTVTSTVQADLSAAIDDDRVLVGPGQALTYAVSVANLGPWPVTSVRLVNLLPAALENPVYVPAVGSYDPGSGAWTGLDLQSGGSVSLTLTATVAAAASGTIANLLSVVPPTGVDDLVAGNNSASDVDVVAADRTELQHGTTRTVSLDAAGQRYFAISQRPYASYEVVVDQVSGDVGELASPFRLERLSSGLTVVTSASATGVGFSRSLRWLNTSATVVDGEAVRMASTSCASDCGPDDAFRVRAYDTTYDLARFNNAAGQGTVVVLQNNGGSSASGRLYFWSASGALLASAPFAALPPRGVLVVNTAALAGTAGVAGSITVANDAPYGTLAGKAVAIDPATGASFDTLLRSRPR